MLNEEKRGAGGKAMEFAAAYTKFWQELGPARKMVLATALAEKVTAWMMSVVVLEKSSIFKRISHFANTSR